MVMLVENLFQNILQTPNVIFMKLMGYHGGICLYMYCKLYFVWFPLTLTAQLFW